LIHPNVHSIAEYFTFFPKGEFDMAPTAVRSTSARKKSAGTIPTKMKAAALDRFGPPSVLTVHELPVPEVGPTEVLISLHSAGVGVWDASVRDGSWNPWGRATFPLIPGMDGAGVIAQKGARARRFDVGDKVWAAHYANPKGGFYAEYVVIDAQFVGNMPKRLDFSQAGAAVVTGLTALQGIDKHLHVRPGQTVLIVGASGGVGTLAVQFAKRLDAEVAGTASGRDAQTLVCRLGADVVVDVRRDDALDRLREFAPDGLDAVLALAGGDDIERCLDLVKKGGRVAYPNGVEPEPGRRKNFTVTAYDGESGYRHLAELEEAANKARLRVPIAAAFPLAQAVRAHERIEKGHILGRIVLRIRR
jgi:NADPH2:quinone reductase